MFWYVGHKVPLFSNITVLHSTMLCAHQRLRYVLLRSSCGAKSSPQLALIGRLRFPYDSPFLQNVLSIAKEFGVARAESAPYQQQNSKMCGHVQLAQFQRVVVRHDPSDVEMQIDRPSLPAKPPIQGAQVYLKPG